MATAKIKTTKPRPAVTKVTLQLDEYEAAVLLRILGNVGGDPMRGTPRAQSDAIYVALVEAGVKPCTDAFNGTIHFLD